MASEDFQPFEEAEHTADLAVTARGRDLRELILNVCRGVIWLISDTEGLEPEEWVPAEAEAPDAERLVVRFVKQLLFEWEMRGGVPVAVELEPASREPTELRGRIGFAHPDDLADRIKGVPKAATYHDMTIRRVGDLLETTLVLDV